MKHIVNCKDCDVEFLLCDRIKSDKRDTPTFDKHEMKVSDSYYVCPNGHEQQYGYTDGKHVNYSIEELIEDCGS